MQHNCRKLTFALVTLILLLGVAQAQAKVIYVKSDGNDALSGNNWAEAKASLWAATTSAVSGDEIWVAGGFYPYTFAWLRPGISLYGGFNGAETNRAQRDWNVNPTVLTSPYWTVVYCEGWSYPEQRVDGFVIRDSINAIFGNWALSVVIQNNVIVNNRNTSTDSYGAGIILFGGGALIQDNHIENNHGNPHGGGIQTYWCYPTIWHNTITRNSTRFHGGGIATWYAPATIVGNVVTDNVAGGKTGGIHAFSGGLIEGNTISRNIAGDETGGFHSCFSTVVVRNNTITDNQARGHDGGGHICASTATLEGNVIRGNSCANGAGGLLISGTNLTFSRNIVSDNTGGAFGGLMLWYCSGSVSDNTFSDNQGGDTGGILSQGFVGSIARNQMVNNTGNGTVGGVNLILFQGNLTDNLISGNHSGHIGGVFSWASGADIRRNTIENNQGGNYGGLWLGAYSGTLDSNNIQNNTGTNVIGGIEFLWSSGVISHNTISGNQGGFAGGLRNIASSATIIYNTITNNVSNQVSGGMEIAESSPLVANNLIAGNQARWGGGIGIGRASPRIINNTIVHNTAESPGGINIWYSSPLIGNNIIAFNTGGGIGSNSSGTLRNNCVFGNTAYNYSGITAGAGDISVNPCFANPTTGRYDLSSGSLCIDAGATSLVQAGWTDHDGLPRVANVGVDIGAYEFQGTPDLSAPTTTAGVSPAPNAAGWNSSPVTVTLSADSTHPDGVDRIIYSATGAETIPQTTVPGDRASFTLSTEGETTVRFYAVDHCGHVEAVKSVTVRIDRTAPEVTAEADVTEIWPPNHKMVPVTVTGRIGDAFSGADLSSATFQVTDQYGKVQPSGQVQVRSDGTYSLTVQLEAWREGTDEDGRIYTIAIHAQDAAGNRGIQSAIVIVPHDQRDKD